MTHWLARIPHLPAWSGWATMRRLAEGVDPWVMQTGTVEWETP